MLSSMGNIEDLIPGAVEQPALPLRAGRLSKVLFTVIMVAAVCVMLPFAGWLAIKTFIWPTQETSTGTCAVYDPDSCVDLTLSFLEDVGRLDLPSNSEVLDSGTSRFLLAGSEWGLVRLPQAADSPGIPPVPDGTFNAHRMERFDELGFVSVNGVRSFAHDRYFTEVITGTDSSGQTLILINRDWNG